MSDSWAQPEPGNDLLAALRGASDRDVAKLVRSVDDKGDPRLIGLLERCLLATSTQPRSLDACAAVVEYVRRVHGLEEITPNERRSFLKQLGRLRTIIRAIALQRAQQARDTGNQADADKIEVQLLAWCEVLGNRLLLERLVQQTRRPRIRGVELPANFTPGNWPFAEEHRPPPEELSDGYLPARSLAAASGCLGVSGEAGSAPDVVAESAPARPPKRLKALLARSRQERPLGELLPEKAVWLRTLFTEDGSMRWWAVHHGKDGTPAVLAHDSRSKGSEARLLHANELFDRTVEDVWSAYQFGYLPADFDTRNLLKQLVDRACDPSGGDRTALLARLEQQPVTTFLERLRAAAPLLPSGQELADQGDQLLREFRAGDLLERDRCHQWLEKVSPPVGSDGKMRRIATDGARDQARREALEAASKLHLETVASLINLTRLQEAGQRNGLDWQTTDLLVTVQGPLWHVPIAWLYFTRG